VTPRQRAALALWVWWHIVGLMPRAWRGLSEEERKSSEESETYHGDDEG
jgi:hypothetical protein